MVVEKAALKVLMTGTQMVALWVSKKDHSRGLLSAERMVGRKEALLDLNKVRR